MTTPEEDWILTATYKSNDESWKPRMHEGDTLYVQNGRGGFVKFVVMDGEYALTEEDAAE
jgi:hypothetical protein